MIANINWKKENKGKGIVAARLQGSPSITPLKNKNVVGSPIKPPIDFPKQRLNWTTIHRTEMIPAETVLLIMVDNTFLRPTIPPYKKARAGVIKNTKAQDTSIQAMSPLL